MRPSSELFAYAAGALVAFGLMSLSLAGPAPRAARAPVSAVIFPPQELPLRFSHVQHLSEVDLECVDCHEDAPTSRSSLDNLIPGEDACAMCHAIDRAQPDKTVAAGRPPARCDACHVGYDESSGAVARVRIPFPNIKFDHAGHIARGTPCSRCHGDFVAEGVTLATRDQLPRMRQCLSCHDGRSAPDACTTCHTAEAGGVVRTHYRSGTLEPSGALRGDAHDMSFRASHAAAAQNDAGYCASCHKKDFCIDCHSGVVKPMDFHVGDYVSQHAVDARRNSPDCSSCHRLQTFCVGCHSRSGVAADGRGSEFVPRSEGPGPRFHPPGWVEVGGLASVRGSEHHSFQAQRNIKQCAACHRESFCTTCHSAQPGSMRVNPHPRSWRGSARCRALAARATRMCLRCHIDSQDLDCG